MNTKTMKHLLTLTILFFAVTAIAHAQTWHYGLKAALTLSGIDGNGMRAKIYPGVQGGVFVEKTFNKKWSIQPEVLLSQTNVSKNEDFLKYYNTDGRTDASEKAKLLYIAVPVLVHYNITPVISIVAGPQYSALIYSNEDLLRGDRDAFKNYELSAVGGVRINLNTVSFYARYNKGLTNINNVDDRYKWTSNQIQAGIAVRIK